MSGISELDVVFALYHLAEKGGSTINTIHLYFAGIIGSNYVIDMKKSYKYLLSVIRSSIKNRKLLLKKNGKLIPIVNMEPDKPVRWWKWFKTQNTTCFDNCIKTKHKKKIKKIIEKKFKDSGTETECECQRNMSEDYIRHYSAPKNTNPYIIKKQKNQKSVKNIDKKSSKCNPTNKSNSEINKRNEILWSKAIKEQTRQFNRCDPMRRRLAKVHSWLNGPRIPQVTKDGKTWAIPPPSSPNPTFPKINTKLNENFTLNVQEQKPKETQEKSEVENRLDQPTTVKDNNEQASWLNLPPKDLVSWHFLTPELDTNVKDLAEKQISNTPLVTLWTNDNYETK